MPFFAKEKELTLFFATDVHGSRVCFRKFLAAPAFYGADVAILGGDVTGKMVVPVVEQAGGTYSSQIAGDNVTVSADEVDVLETRIADAGFYPYRTDPDEMKTLNEDPSAVEKIFVSCMIQTLGEWGDLAEKKYAGSDRVIYVAPGNDDPWEIDQALRAIPRFRVIENEVVTLPGGYEMIATGYSNPTPWKTHREVTEEDLKKRIDALAARVESMQTAIFNLHVPPYNSGLDVGPDIDPDTWVQRVSGGQPMTKPVGSEATRKAIEEFQPMLALHGHIHESRGTSRIGKTLCINPGSDYGDKVLRGCVIKLKGGAVRGFQLTAG